MKINSMFCIKSIHFNLHQHHDEKSVKEPIAQYN